MINTIEIKWDLLGAKLASLGDDAQSEFFKGFAMELSSPSYESHYRREMQMMCVNERLSQKVKDVLAEYLPSLWYKDSAGSAYNKPLTGSQSLDPNGKDK